MTGRQSKLNDILKLGQDYLYKQAYIKNGEVIPSIAGLALYANCARSSLYNYANSSDEFKDILELIKARQEVELINKGLIGEFNASIAKLMLANHGYSDKQTLNHTVKDEVESKPVQDLTDEELEAELAKYGIEIPQIKRPIHLNN